MSIALFSGSYRVKFVLDSNLGGAGLPDEKALQAIQKYVSFLKYVKTKTKNVCCHFIT